MARASLSEPWSALLPQPGQRVGHAGMRRLSNHVVGVLPVGVAGSAPRYLGAYRLDQRHERPVRLPVAQRILGVGPGIEQREVAVRLYGAEVAGCCTDRQALASANDPYPVEGRGSGHFDGRTASAGRAVDAGHAPARRATASVTPTRWSAR